LHRTTPSGGLPPKFAEVKPLKQLWCFNILKTCLYMISYRICHCNIVSLMHQELWSHFCFVLNTFIISDVYGAEQMALCIIYYFQVYFHIMFQCFAQFSNLFLNVFLLYFRFFFHFTCLALQWTDHLNGRRFLCIEVHRDCSSWLQCSTVWRLKAISSEGLYVTIASENCNFNLTLDITVVYASFVFRCFFCQNWRH